MKFFLDTGDISEVEDLVKTGLIAGVTTNPSLAAKSGMPFHELISRICSLLPGYVSAEVVAADAPGMIEQGRKLAKIAENVVIKVPLTMEGLKACLALSEEDILVNVTLCFSPVQALMAARSGATFVSPFVGRVDDIGWDGMGMIREIRRIYDEYYLETSILAASIRHPVHVLEAAKMGSDYCTVPPKVFRQLYHHPLTDIGLAGFNQDWEKSGLSI